MDSAQTYRILLRVVSEITGEPESALSPSTRLIDDLALDSLDLTQVVAVMEDEIGSILTLNTLPRTAVETLGAFAGYLSSQSAR